MNCAAIAVLLVSETISYWSMTGVPVNICQYKVGDVYFNERQIGINCDKQPYKIPDNVMLIAMHNACTVKEK